MKLKKENLRVEKEKTRLEERGVRVGKGEKSGEFRKTFEGVSIRLSRKSYV